MNKRKFTDFIDICKPLVDEDNFDFYNNLQDDKDIPSTDLGPILENSSFGHILTFIPKDFIKDFCLSSIETMKFIIEDHPVFMFLNSEKNIFRNLPKYYYTYSSYGYIVIDTSKKWFRDILMNILYGNDKKYHTHAFRYFKNITLYLYRDNYKDINADIQYKQAMVFQNARHNLISDEKVISRKIHLGHEFSYEKYTDTIIRFLTAQEGVVNTIHIDSQYSILPNFILNYIFKSTIDINIIKELDECVNTYNLYKYMSSSTGTLRLGNIKYYLSKGGDISYPPKLFYYGGLPLLIHAMRKNNVEVVNYLIENIEDIESNVFSIESCDTQKKRQCYNILNKYLKNNCQTIFNKIIYEQNNYEQKNGKNSN